MDTRKKFLDKSSRANLNFLFSQSENDNQSEIPAQLLAENSSKELQQNESRDDYEGEEEQLIASYLDEGFDVIDNELNTTDEEASDDDVFNLPFRKFLAHWIISYNIPRTACNTLLKYINNKIDKTIPTTYMSLLKTPTTTTVISIPPGEYIHLGIVQAIEMCKLDFSSYKKNHTFYLDMNTDGVSVSSNFYLKLILEVFYLI